MRKTPRWYDDAVARHARLIIEDGESQDQALVSLRMLVRDEHGEFGNVILDDWNSPRLATAIAAARSQRAAEIRDRLRRAEAKRATVLPPAPPRPPMLTPAGAPNAAPSRPDVPSAATDEVAPPALAPPAPARTMIRPEQSAPVISSGSPGRSTETDEITSLRRELETLEPPSDLEWDLHCTLFPDFPFRSLRITPERYRKVHEMNGHELDMAKNVLYAKTGNAIKGAEDERRVFDKFYNRVRPLMQADDTVADAERKLRSQAEHATAC